MKAQHWIRPRQIKKMYVYMLLMVNAKKNTFSHNSNQERAELASATLRLRLYGEPMTTLLKFIQEINEVYD